MRDVIFQPGEVASRTGHYEEQNASGVSTGRSVRAEIGELLPSAPRGFTWKLLREHREHDSREAPTRD
jgi:hypothetical protein